MIAYHVIVFQANFIIECVKFLSPFLSGSRISRISPIQRYECQLGITWKTQKKPLHLIVLLRELLSAVGRSQTGILSVKSAIPYAKEI